MIKEIKTVKVGTEYGEMLRPPTPPISMTTPRGLDGICPRCQGRGFILFIDGFGLETMRDCECREVSRQRRVAARLMQMWESEIPLTFQDFTFDTFPADADKSAALETCQRYARERPLTSLYLSGPLGRGKSGLALCTARQWIKHTGNGASMLFVTAPGLFQELRATFNHKSRSTFDEKITALSAVDLLIIDDLGVVKPSAWIHETTFVFINARHNAQRATIFTADVNEDTIAQIYSPRVADRIYAMTRDWRVVVGGRNLRR